MQSTYHFLLFHVFFLSLGSNLNFVSDLPGNRGGKTATHSVQANDAWKQKRSLRCIVGYATALVRTGTKLILTCKADGTSLGTSWWTSWTRPPPRTVLRRPNEEVLESQFSDLKRTVRKKYFVQFEITLGNPLGAIPGTKLDFCCNQIFKNFQILRYSNVICGEVTQYRPALKHRWLSVSYLHVSAQSSRQSHEQDYVTS